MLYTYRFNAGDNRQSKGYAEVTLTAESDSHALEMLDLFSVENDCTQLVWHQTNKRAYMTGVVCHNIAEPCRPGLRVFGDSYADDLSISSQGSHVG